jgi:hypothetical protein
MTAVVASVINQTTMKTKRLIHITVSVIIFLIIIAATASLMHKEDFALDAYTWNADFGPKGESILIRGNKLDGIKGDINKLIFAVNKSDKDPETFRTPKDKEPADLPKLKLVNVNGDTAHIEVINAGYLTQRMGSTGAEQFLAIATFTLTECDNIRYVNFIFEEGDHAIPGYYSRRTFSERWVVRE